MQTPSSRSIRFTLLAPLAFTASLALGGAASAAPTTVTLNVPVNSEWHIHLNPLANLERPEMNTTLRLKLKQMPWSGWSSRAGGAAAGGCIIGSALGGYSVGRGGWVARKVAARVIGGCALGAVGAAFGSVATTALLAISSPAWFASLGGVVIAGATSIGAMALFDHLFHKKHGRGLLTSVPVVSYARAQAHWRNPDYETKRRVLYSTNTTITPSYGRDIPMTSLHDDHCHTPTNCYNRLAPMIAPTVAY